MRLPSNFRLPTGRALLLVAAISLAFASEWWRTPAQLGFLACLAVYVALVGYDLVTARKHWLDRAVNPIILAPPFEDRWYVAAGGPNPGHNHHRIVSDQYFAYDFLRDAGDSWDQPILAPCDGMIVHVENRQPDAAPNERVRNPKRPFGNYVSIQTPHGYVILAHLKEGSVSVRVGDSVRTGQPIGRCGNSGNTSRAHLHLHAQDQPSQSIDVANGIPVAFTDRFRSEPLILEYGDRLG